MVGVFIALDSHQQLLLSDFLIVVSFVVSLCVYVSDLFLAVLDHCSSSLVVVSRGSSPAPVLRLMVVASLVGMALGCAGSGVVVPGLQSTGSVIVAHGLSCSAACGIFLDQGSNLCLLHWQADPY